MTSKVVRFNQFLSAVKQFFCRHSYNISMLVGLGFSIGSKDRSSAGAKDGAEIMVDCPKCHKHFAKALIHSDGEIVQV